MSIFFINSNICRHLKLEIALAILASNEIEANNSAAQGLIITFLKRQIDLMMFGSGRYYRL